MQAYIREGGLACDLSTAPLWLRSAQFGVRPDIWRWMVYLWQVEGYERADSAYERARHIVHGQHTDLRLAVDPARMEPAPYCCI